MNAKQSKKMKEASVVKYYFTKYFFLAFGLLQLCIALIVFIRQGSYIKGQFAASVFLTLGLVFVSLYVLVSSRLKRVAIGKKKVAVIGAYKTQRYEWCDIKSVELMPVFRLYCMKVKGKKGKIYFLPAQETAEIYNGILPMTPEFALKKVK